MARTRYDTRKFSQKEWDEADKLKRLYIHMIDPYRWPLTEAMTEMHDNYKKVWAIMMSITAPRQRIVDISLALDISDRQAYEYVKNAEYLFGEILDVNPWIEMRLIYNRLSIVSEKAEKEGDFDTATKAAIKAAEVLEKIEKNKPRKEKVYTAITITTNPAALASRIATEDADYIEIDGTVPEPETERVLLDREAV